MLKHKGGETVKAGLYWNPKEWEAQIVPPEGGGLKGTEDTAYIRLPLLAVLFLAPIMGGLYAFFLPFIGFAMLVKHLGRRLRSRLTGTTTAAADATGTATMATRAGREQATEKGRRAA